MFTDNRRVLTVRDEIDLSGAYDMYWFMHTGANVEITSETTATLTYGTKKLYVQFMVEGRYILIYNFTCMYFCVIIIDIIL